MLFNSLAFIAFLLISFSVFWIIPQKNIALKNAVLLLASYIFYGFWDWRFLGLIAFSTLVDFIAAQQIFNAQTKKKKKFWLFLSVSTNLGLLGFFKYYNFFLDGFAELLNSVGLASSQSTLQIILPVGISFYTFQTLSYTLDVYRQKMAPTQNFIQFAVFVAFFPQLVAGPIERAAHLLPQFAKRKSFSYSYAKSGLFLILYGFFKKIAIADNIGFLIDPVFNSPEHYFNWEMLFAIVGFTFQIYADFSGYSDIAIGLAMLFGYHLNTNFKTPFFAFSIQEFWQRWHISLSTWFRDYVYIPLGGNKSSKKKWARNILITFGLSGLWHGAGLTFVFFGLFHGLYYILETVLRFRKDWLANAALTFLAVVFGFLLFRANSIVDVPTLLNNLTNFNSFAPFVFSASTFALAYLIIVFVVLEYSLKNEENFAQWIQRKTFLFKVTVSYLLVFSTLLFGQFSLQENFIYFQF